MNDLNDLFKPNNFERLNDLNELICRVYNPMPFV